MSAAPTAAEPAPTEDSAGRARTSPTAPPDAARALLEELGGPTAPLPPSVQVALSNATGADMSGFAMRADARTDEALGAASVAAFVAGRTLLLPTAQAGPETPGGARRLLAAAMQALDGVSGPVDPERPLVDPASEQPPPDFETSPPPPETSTPSPKPTPRTAAAPAAAPPAPEAPAGGPTEAGGAEPAPAPGPAAPTPTPAGGDAVELQMPPARGAPGPRQQARQRQVAGAAGGAGRAAKDVPSAEATTAAARGAVSEPAAETAARAQAELTAELGERPPPSPEIVALCERIRKAIRERRPVDEDELRKANPEKEAAEAGAGLSSSIGAKTDEVKSGYAPLDSPPAGTPQLTPQPITPPPPAVRDPGIDAQRAAPDPIPPENLSLDADKAALDRKVADARIERTTSEPIADPPFSTVREGQAEFSEMAATGPGQVADQQTEALASAQQGMAELQQTMLGALRSSRSSTVRTVSGGQTAMVGSEEAQRAAVSAEAKAIFDQARNAISTPLAELGPKAMARWNAGVASLSNDFRIHLDKVKRWVDERHAGWTGAVVGVWDDWTGFPGWITDEYTKAERAFGEGVCELLIEISREVNEVVAAAQVIIENARTAIDKRFAELPEGLRAWAEGERRRFGEQLDGLTNQVEAARTHFVEDTSAQAVTAVAEAQAEVEELREAAKGVLGKVYDALNAFLEDPVKAIVDGLLTIVGIPPASFWALIARIQQVATEIAEDPVRFLNNLVAALKQGFQQFFDNFGTHVIGGFWKWLFSGLAKVGVTLPPDTSLGSLVSLALQIMGISWPRIRTVLVKHIGEQNVALIEQAWQLVSTLVTQGPAGVFQMLKDALDPAKIVDEIVSAAVDFLIEALIKQVAVRIIALLNPAGAVLQAVELIYKVVKWVFENAARIFQLVETVVGGIADIMAGSIGGAATAIESALASTVPVVIDFLAGLLGLGDLPEKIADVIGRLQAYVLGIVDRVVGFLVKKAKALLKAIGIGGEERAADSGADTELGKEVRFGGGGKSHRQWIDPAGTPMVGSTAETVKARLGRWEDEAPVAFASDETKRAEADAALAAATATLERMTREAEALAAAYRAREPDKPLPSDDPLEALQLELSGHLSRLFTLFVGDPKALVGKIRRAMPRHGRPRATEIIKRWKRRTDDFRIGNEPNDPKLWPRSPFVGIRAGALAVAASESTAQQLLPWYTAATGKPGPPTTAAFGNYALVQRSAPHTVRRDFTVALASKGRAKLKQAAQRNVAKAKDVDPGYKQKLLERVGRIAFNWTPGGGVWTLPTKRLPDHDRYRPLNVDTSTDGRETTYTTITGQSFTVRMDPATKMATEIEGTNLRLGIMPPGQRGRMGAAPYTTPGQGFDAAHLIADRFGGSGYVAGLNLVATSEHYNRKLMAGAEREIADAVELRARDAERSRTEIAFSLNVSLTTAALLDETVLAEIKANPSFKAADHPELDPLILQKIRSGEVSAELRRVRSTTYKYVIDGGAVEGTIPLGEDVWLLNKA